MSFTAVISNCSSFAVRALRFARLASMFLTEFSIMSSVFSGESSSLSALSLAFAFFFFCIRRCRSFLVRTSGRSISSYSYVVSNNFSHVLFVKLEVKGGRQRESSSRRHHSTPAS